MSSLHNTVFDGISHESRPKHIDLSGWQERATISQMFDVRFQTLTSILSLYQMERQTRW